MLRYLGNDSMARKLHTHTYIYTILVETFLQEIPVSTADQLLIENPKASYIRPLGFLLLGSGERRG